MITTSADSLARHLKDDLGIAPDDLVFLFSGVWGLGRLEGGLGAITDAFRRVLLEGLLIVPTFSYSWCRGEAFDPARTPCPDMGAYPNFVFKQEGFVRTGNPNFSVAALCTDSNRGLVEDLFAIDHTCFGERSVLGNIVRYARGRRALILLLGGAFNDCLFRCTFIHYVQQKFGAPHRYEKAFRDPAGSGRVVTQLVRYLSREEYVQVNGREPGGLRFPVEEDFGPFGVELERRRLLVRKPFAYYESRMTTVPDCCGVFEERLRADPCYCLKNVPA
jgi:aminoglycoside N3'-acetyltransferase